MSEATTINEAKTILESVNKTLAEKLNAPQLSLNRLKGVLIIVIREEHRHGGLLIGKMKPIEILESTLSTLVECNTITIKEAEAFLHLWIINTIKGEDRYAKQNI